MTDVIVTLSALVVAGGFGYLYYRDINQQLNANGQKPVGTVIYTQNVAQRRFNDRVVWQSVGDNTPLYNLDSVRTTNGSNAVIRLLDGTKIVMQPNSLITLDWTGKTKTVQFLSGSITAIRTGGGGSSAAATGRGAASPAAAGAANAPPSGLVIKSGKSIVRLDRATVNLLAQPGNKLAVTVSDGKASLVSGGSVQTLSVSNAASVNTATGSASISTVHLLPTAPAQNAIYVTQQTHSSVPFAWTSTKRLPRYTLEVSSSSDFASTAQSVETSVHTADVSLTSGVHYWRIAAGGESSPAEQVTVLHDSPVSLLSPNPASVYTYDTSPPLVFFSWTASKVASGYELQIARNRAFTNMIEQIHTATNAIAVGKLTSGNYFWRVKPLYDFSTASNVSVSTESSFRVVQAATLKPADLVSPKAKAVLNAVAIQSTGVLFNWQPDDTIADWSFTIARKPDMTGVIAHVATSDNFYLLRKTLHPGRYYWQVRGATANGTAAPASPVRSLTVSLENAKITLRSPRQNWNYDGATVANVPVLWKSDVKGNFEVDLSTNPNFSTNLSKIETTFDTAHFGSLPPATYYWHVRLLARDGSTLLSSPRGTFTVLSPLIAPRPISPAGGRVLTLINPKKIDFTWDGDPRSRYYDFALYRTAPNGTKQKVASTLDLTENHYSFTGLSALAVGQYTWIIAAHSPAGFDTSAQATLPVSANFTIGELRFVRAPGLETPADGGTVAGVTALDRGVNFSWISPSTNATAVVQVATDSSFTHVIHRRVVGAGVDTVHLPQMLPGSYYWRVTARTRDGIKAPTSATSTFTVTPLPALPEPATLSPAPGGTVDMWNKKELSLSWSAVPDATGYTISLTNEKTGAAVFDSADVSGTSYRYSQLQNLDVGTFIWKIQAYQRDREGTVVRTSLPLQVKFAIVLGNKIGTPTVKAPSRVFVH